MPMQNNASAQDVKKEKEAVIFDAACRVIREKGFHQARMADIAARAGISYGLVYHYYNSKADLFDALMDAWWNGLEDIIDGLADDPGPVESKLKAIAAYYLDQYQRRPDLVHVFITELSRSSSNLTPERLKRFKRLMDSTEEIIARAQGRGDLRLDLKPRYLTYYFLGAIEALLSSMVLENQLLKTEKQKQRLTNAVLTAFLEGARRK